MKRCPKCKKRKDESEFSKNRARPDGLSDYCKACERKRVRAYAYKIRGGPPAKRRYAYEQTHRVVRGVKQKRCSKCRGWKRYTEYYKHRRNTDGLDAWCKDCLRKSQKRKRIAAKKKLKK